jgi:DNA-binding GntR family transcriptional regulator
MRLEEEALVDVFPQHATLVSPIDLGLVHQAHFLRRALETEVMRVIAAEPDEALVQRLCATLDRQKALHALDDLDGFTAEDRAFHRQMFEAAHVPDLWTLVRSRSGHLDRLRRLHLPSPGKAAAVMRDHSAIVKAIAARDPEQAQDAMRRHLAGTVSNINDIRARYPDYIRA